VLATINREYVAYASETERERRKIRRKRKENTKGKYERKIRKENMKGKYDRNCENPKGTRKGN
jgi:hypothetical protein